MHTRLPRVSHRRRPRRRGQAAIEYIIITLMVLGVLFNLLRLMTRSQASTYIGVQTTILCPYWNAPSIPKIFTNLIPSAWFNDYIGITALKDWLNGLQKSPPTCPGGDSS